MVNDKMENGFMKTIEGFRLRKLGNEYILENQCRSSISTR